MDLNVVAFNVPWPADYGGVIDVFHRIRTLAEMGVRVHLYCYTYGRPEADELNACCASVHYFQRRMSPLRQLSRRPYIVATRASDDLVQCLERNDYPILLEGVHTCDVLERLHGDRPIFVRAHNVEQDYYAALANVEPTLWRRLFFRLESLKLRHYETVLKQADAVFAVTRPDADFFLTMGCRRVELMPSSHACDDVVSKVGVGEFALYHSDLSVPENRQAVLWLASQVFAHVPYRLVVAGRNPDKSLIEALSCYGNIEVVPSPSDAEMARLQREAHVNVLFTQQPTGLKLKLLHSLFSGRHCLVNRLMVAGTGLEALCHIADDGAAMAAQLETLMPTPFTDNEVERRRQILTPLYGNKANAERLLRVARQCCE